MKKISLVLLSAAAFLLGGTVWAGGEKVSDMAEASALLEEVPDGDEPSESDCGIKSIPYMEDFSAEHWIDDTTLQCWTIVNNNNDNKTWTKDASNGVDKSACAKYPYASASAADDYLISPRIEINKAASLSFKVKVSSASNEEKYSVLVSTTGVDIADFTTLKEEETINNTEFKTVSVDLSSFIGNQIYIAIKASSDKNKYNLLVDDFMVVSCAAPTGIAAERASAADYEITWNTAAAQTEFSYKKTSEEAFTKVFLTENKYTLSVWDDNTSYTVRLRAVCGEGDTSLYSDAFSFTTGYGCEAPSGMAVSKKDNGYELSWTNFAEKTLVYYKKTDAADYASVEISGQSYLFTGLDAGALYSVKLRSLCGAADTSLYSADYSFTTECGMATIPYLENFEADHWISADALLCWTILDSNGDRETWERNNYSGVNGGLCAACDYSYSSTNPSDYLISPQIDLAKSASLSFKVKGNEKKYRVLISTTGTDYADFSVLQEERTATGDYETVTIDLSSYTGQKVYIAINAREGKTYFYVDDFMVVSCGAPTDVAMTEIKETSAKVDFVTPASDYVVAYKKVAENTWIEQNASTKPVELTNLDPGYAYEVKVKALCSADDESLFSDAVTFTTPCFAFDFPLIEDFSAPTIPLCWDSTQWQGNNGAWKIYENWEGRCVQFEASSNNIMGKLSTPDVDLTGVDRERLELAMTYNFSNYGSQGERLWISYSTDKGLTWDTINEYTENNKKETLIIKLGEYVGQASTVRIRLEAIAKGSYSFSIRVYDLKIRLEPICFPPTNLRIEDEILYNEARLVWTAPDSSNDGAVKAYNVVYKDVESDASQNVQANDTAITLNGLTQHTQYEARVSAVCQTESSEEVKIAWETPYSCLKVDALRLNALLPTQASLSWQSKHASFEIQYKEDTATEWNKVEDITEKTCTLQDLRPSAAYTVKVRAICGSDDASLWDSISFVMPQGIVSLPYEEDFEFVKNNVPDQWEFHKLSGDNDEQWIVTTVQHKVGEQSMMYNTDKLRPGNVGVLSSPLLDFSWNAVYTLEFWMYRNEKSASKNIEGLKVFLSDIRNDTVGAKCLAYIHNSPQKDPVVTEVSEDGWYHYSIELKDITDYHYILLCGISEYGYDFYVDDFKVNALYETNLGVVKVEPIVPRANLGEESVAFSLNNTGLDDFSGSVNFCFSVDGKDTVRETVSFAEESLAPETEFDYTFAAKADFSEVGEHELSVWVEAEGDPVFDNAASIKVLHYAPVSLPYITFFCDSIEQEEYIHTMNLNQDSLSWSRESDSGMYLAPNADLAANDIFFTPGVQMPAGLYEIEVAYGTATEGKTESMRLDLTEGFDIVGGVEVATMNTITQTNTSSVYELHLEEAGIYMLRFTARSDKDQGGLNVSALKIVNTLAYVELSESICQGDTYPLGENDLTEAGVYTDTLRHADATDTIITLTLTVNPVYGFSLDTAICEGQRVEFGGRSHTESGDFKMEYKTVSGCDSIYSLKLTVNPKAVAPVIEGKQDEGRRQWTLTAVSAEPRIQWYVDNAEIADANELVYVAVEEGVYHAVAENDCGKSGESNKIEVKYVANEGADMAKAPAVYPNPARETVYLKASEPIERVVIYAANGKTVKRIAGRHTEKLSLSVRDVKAGIYVMQITLASGVYNYKLVVNE